MQTLVDCILKKQPERTVYMKKKIRLLVLVMAMISMFAITASATASYGYSRYLGLGRSGYLRVCDNTGSTSTSTSNWVFYPNSYLTVSIDSNSAMAPMTVNFATQGGSFLKSVSVSSGIGSAGCSRTGNCIVQLDHPGAATTLTGKVTVN